MHSMRDKTPQRERERRRERGRERERERERGMSEGQKSRDGIETEREGE